jgi:Uma2 family endonuclease
VEARALHKLTLDEYVAFDRAAEGRFEYVNGEAWAMSGGRPEHGVVVGNVFAALRSQLREKACMAFNEGQKIATVRTGAYHYPDASVVCGSPMWDASDDHAFTNPTLIVEVLSPTTADYDRGGKFVHYRTIESFREYVVVDEAARLVEHHARVSDEQWVMTVHRAGSVALVSVGVSLALDELWADVERVKAG